ncbi:hypothetical protein MMC07_001205 [Pseudocyphellaria aurata]|nr:hypothetical protein [Pseudocyphellaria aurata]
MLIRKDIRETELGIDLLLDMQIINVYTCESMKDGYVDFWMANLTGVYSDIASEKTATGQIFFQQSTLTLVNQIVPYSLDTNTLTLNSGKPVFPRMFNQNLPTQLTIVTISDDGILQMQGDSMSQDSFVELRPLGCNISAGFIGTINVAVDPDSVPAPVGVGPGGMNGNGRGPPPCSDGMELPRSGSGRGPPPSS